MRCKICNAPAPLFARARVLAKHDIQYVRCEACGFIQTEHPFWLDEAYSDAITRSDLGLVNRNVTLFKLVRPLLLAFFDPNARFVDYGGGYGLFVRLMRDAGLDFYLYDKYCDNLFARGFEARPDRHELLTAFEVFEHLADPLAEIEQMLTFSRNLLFTTTLLPAPPPPPDAWWYYGLEHGQHIALYTPAALGAIARKLDLRLYSDGRALHLLTEKHIPPRLFRLALHHRVAPLLDALLARRLARATRLPSDYQALTGKPLA